MFGNTKNFVQELQETVSMMKIVIQKGIRIHENNKKLCHIQVYHNQALITGPLWFKEPEIIVEYEKVECYSNHIRWGLIVKALEVLEQSNYCNEKIAKVTYNPCCGTINILE